MENLQAMQTQDLLDLLANKTEQLTSTLTRKDKAEVRRCEIEVRLIQDELKTREKNNQYHYLN